jgi:hypothetical protein
MEKLRLELTKERGLTSHLREELEAEKAVVACLKNEIKAEPHKRNLLVSEADHRRAASRIGQKEDDTSHGLVKDKNMVIKRLQQEVVTEKDKNIELEDTIKTLKAELEEQRHLAEMDRRDYEVQKKAVAQKWERMKGKIRLQAQLQQQERTVTQQTMLNLRQQLAKTTAKMQVKMTAVAAFKISSPESPQRKLPTVAKLTSKVQPKLENAQKVQKGKSQEKADINGALKAQINQVREMAETVVRDLIVHM